MILSSAQPMFSNFSVSYVKSAPLTIHSTNRLKTWPTKTGTDGWQFRNLFPSRT